LLGFETASETSEPRWDVCARLTVDLGDKGEPKHPALSNTGRKQDQVKRLKQGKDDLSVSCPI